MKNYRRIQKLNVSVVSIVLHDLDSKCSFEEASAGGNIYPLYKNIDIFVSVLEKYI